MVLEATALAAAIKGSADLVREALSLAETIRSGLRADNEKAKKELTDRLAALEQVLPHVSALAAMTERYVRLHEDLVGLLSSTQRAQHLLVDSLEDFNDSKNPRYAGSWRVMETLFSEIDAERGPIQEATYNRTEWSGQRDRDQVEPLLAQFETAYQTAAQAVRYRASSDVRANLEQMVRPMQTAESLIRNTLYGDILPALQELARRDGSGNDR
jgi:hypothetical protein